MTNTSTKRPGRNTAQDLALTRYERPGGIIGVSGPLGEIEYTPASGAISYHGIASRYPGHQQTPCPGHPHGTCYHSDGRDAATLTRVPDGSSRADEVLYGYIALEALYAGWDAEKPSRLGVASATPAGKSGRPESAARSRVRTRSSRLPELRRA